MVGLEHRDRIPVEIDGDELVVYNHVTVRETRYVRPGEIDAHDPIIYEGHRPIDGVDAITHWVARELADIEVAVPDYVDVIDPTENHVTVLYTDPMDSG